MADIFLSYARRERHQAEPVKVALESLGLEVFFDVDGLDGGDVFPDVLDRELKTAGAVVSLWSPWSLTRPWIKIESRIAKDRGVLIPVDIASIDPLHDLPAAFYDVQRIDLMDFTGDTAHPGWIKLVKSLARTLRRPELLEREARTNFHSSAQTDELQREVDSLRAQIGDIATAKAAAASRNQERKEAFALIDKSISLSDYRRFLDRFTDGAEAFEAERRIDQLEMWAKVDRSRPDAVSEFLTGTSFQIYPALAEEARRIQKQARTPHGSRSDARWAVLGVGALILGISIWASMPSLQVREDEPAAFVFPTETSSQTTTYPSVPDSPGFEAVGTVQSSTSNDSAVDFQLSYKLVSENFSVASEIDPTIRSFDQALSNKLWKETKEALDELALSADEDKAAAEKQSLESGKALRFMRYELGVYFKAHAVLDDVIAVTRSVHIFTGGAHPNSYYTAFNNRRGEAEPLPLSAFIANERAFHELVVKGLVAEKLDRFYESSDAASIESELRKILVPTESNPDVYAGRFVLEKSTEAGKVGGISVLFSPYDVGAYAEGPYTVTLTAAELASILNDHWKSRFGGEPIVNEG